VLFSTHILSDVEAICDRVGILVEGSLTDCGNLADLVASGARAVELVVENAAPELVERLRQDGTHVLQRDRATVLTFADEARARSALNAAVSSGATIISLTPHRRTLEELFVSRARGKAATS
jgi:ABC-2 type transport system ATP-binding protein